MNGSPNFRRTTALAAASVLTLWGAAPALADPGHGNGAGHGNSGSHSHAGSTHGNGGSHGTHGNGGSHHGQSGSHGHSGSTHGNSGGSHGQSGSHGHSGSTHGNSGGSHGNGGTHGNSGSSHGNSGSHGNGGGHGNGVTPGNNGTVKIAPLGEMDSIPNNSPHPGCSFEVEWYGFDQGKDIVSTVTFSPQAPTRDAGISVDGPTHVFVGGDPATGAGTATGLDGRETYTLSFTGTPHPKQGYHVRLTVATPHSLGNDTKTKVFWVAPCESTGGGTNGGDNGGGSNGGGSNGGGSNGGGSNGGGSNGGGTGGTTGSSSGGGTDTSSGSAGDHASGQGDVEVLGEQASTPTQANGSDQVPTAVDSGESGHSAIGQLVRSPWPLAIVVVGALLTLGAVLSRRRSGARTDIEE